MITPWNLYWITRLDGIKNLVLGTTGFTVFLLLVGALAIFGYCGWKEKWTRKSIAGIVGLVLAAFASGSVGKAVETLVPTTKEMATIVVLPRIANSETVQEIGEDVKNLVKEWILQLKPKGGRGMMTPDEIIAAHAARPPSRFHEPEDAARSNWWESRSVAGGDLRAFARGTLKEDKYAEKRR